MSERTPVAWIASAKHLPPCGAPRSAASGWSPWLLCTNAERPLNDHDGDYPEVFTASYSSVLRLWHNTRNEKVVVTHWAPAAALPEKG